MAFENVFKKCGVHFKSQILKFMIQQKDSKKKICRMIRLNVPNFLYTNDNSLLGCFKCKNMQFSQLSQ